MWKSESLRWAVHLRVGGRISLAKRSHSQNKLFPVTVEIVEIVSSGGTSGYFPLKILIKIEQSSGRQLLCIPVHKRMSEVEWKAPANMAPADEKKATAFAYLPIIAIKMA